MRSGVIIAGGRSTRFGCGDKAVADLAGIPMVRRVADRLATVTDEVVINCRPEQRSAIEEALCDLSVPVSLALDEEPDLGPTAGIRNGLRAATGEYAAVVACDMPFVDQSVISHLFERAVGHDAAVPRLDDEWFQTTQAVYRAQAMANACDAALERGDRKVVAAVFDLDYVVIDRSEIEAHGSLETFENINTRDELAAAEERLG